jgi:hypothetical protein
LVDTYSVYPEKARAIFAPDMSKCRVKIARDTHGLTLTMEIDCAFDIAPNVRQCLKVALSFLEAASSQTAYKRRCDGSSRKQLEDPN